MKTISYQNKETGKTVELALDKRRIFIYGKNGSGKTTLSNSSDLDDKYVFNEVFIRRNVFVINEDGATIDTNVKNNISGLLLGEEVIKIRKNQNNLTEIHKNLEKKIDDIEIKAKTKLNSNYIEASYNILKDSLKDDSIILSDCYDIETKLNNYNYDYFDDKFKHLGESDMKISLAQIRNNSTLKNLVDKIKNTKYLKEFILISDDETNTNNLNASLDVLDKNKNEIIKIEEILKRKKINAHDWKTVKECLDLQDKNNIEECILCGNKNYKEGIKAWEILKSNDCNKIKTSISEQLDKEINAISTDILSNRDLYNEIAPNTITSIESFLDMLKEIKHEVENNEISKRIEKSKINIEKLVINLDELILNVSYNLLKSLINPYVYYNSLSKLVSEEISKLKIEIRNIMSKDADDYSNSINEILFKLGVDNKNVDLKVDNRGDDIKYSLKIKENSLAELSDGQKHKLALAVFLHSIKNKDLTNKVLVFDDPIVSLDEMSYHRFKDYLIREILMKYKDISDGPYLIILTHNFGYFNIQISNIIEKEELQKDSKILRIDSDGLHQMNPDSFKLDDIALYKNGINKATIKSNILDLAMISNKIIRELIDIKLRFSGNVINDNPSKEIPLLENSDTEKKEIKKCERKTVEFRKSKSNEISAAIECVKYVQKVAKLLGFDGFIKDGDIERLYTIEEISGKMSDENIIIYEIADLFRTYDETNNYIRYLNHPRISFTKNMFSSALDLHK